MISHFFRRWEQQLAAVDTNRFVRPFEWGLDWLELADQAGTKVPASGKLASGDPASDNHAADAIDRWVARAMQDTDTFFHVPPTTDYELTDGVLRFPSALVTPAHPRNNVVTVRVFPAELKPGQPRRAVVVLPQWNSDPEGHVGLCKLFARFGITALRLSLPYHDSRKPEDLERAEYIVSPNIGRTLHANRQAVLDAKRTVDWAVAQGYRVGIVGTSLGSCLSMLTMAHDSRVKVGAFNHVSPYFADVVWRGLSTRHVREGLETHVSLDTLRRFWMPISPWPFIDRVRGRRILLVYATYDLTFPLDLSRQFIAEFVNRDVPHETAVLPCGHYTTGKAPFKFLDGYYLTKFLVKAL